MSTSFPCTGCLSYGEVLNPNSLPIYFRDAYGQPGDPFEVKYTLYWENPDCPGTYLQVGPALQTPVKGMVGYYYASGVAGQCGGPGCWRIRWYYREFSGGPQSSVDFYFKVAQPTSSCASSCSSC